ncbi:MAG: general secretion pathway protein J [Syntrophorhabdus sp. PtaU1.Bin153]|nr:MAG: general secretion pathway protein J [Syntrophorhabdus sp. PtaU1.Bin153]
MERRAGQPGGFTLLELVISITLVVVILLIVAGATTLGYRAVGSGERRMDADERLRASLMIIDAQIQSAAPLTFNQGGTKEYYFKGDRESLRLSTNYSIWGGQRGYVIVAYKVETDTKGKRVLSASENKVGTEADTQETRLLDNFDEIFFEYRVQEDADKEKGEWIDQWSEKTVIPQSIRLNLVRAGSRFSVIVPMRVEGTIGQIESDETEIEDRD